MKRARRGRILVFLLFLILTYLLCLGFSILAARFLRESTPVQGVGEEPFCGVVLDAGHGGEDGGTASVQGYYEKDLNLALCRELCTMLQTNGIPVVMTRNEDTLLYDKTSDYHGRKKALDLLARRKIGEKHPDFLFLSIHMNAYPLPQYHGLQVWYSKNHEVSEEVAKKVQETVSSTLQPQNDRSVKEADRGIYLLYHLTSPAILVECGFLSNPEEAERLNDPEYQKQLAFLLTLAIAESKNRG